MLLRELDGLPKDRRVRLKEIRECCMATTLNLLKLCLMGSTYISLDGEG